MSGLISVRACVCFLHWFLLCVCVMCVYVQCQRDSLVARPLNKRCEGGCSVTTSPSKTHLTHIRDKKPQDNRHKNTQALSMSERLVQLQKCMKQHEPATGKRGDGADSLAAILALMTAVLTECDLHCHSQRLREMASRLEGAAVGRNGQKDLLLLLKSITQSGPEPAIQRPPTVSPSSGLYPQSCYVIFEYGIKENGIYTIQPDPQRPALEVVCDMESAGGGWTVFQRRFDGQLDFNRTWQEYRDGFGSLQREHWLGNAVLHSLTATGQHTLRITLQDWYHQTRHANYNNFKVAGENQRFRLTAQNYQGDAGNALSYSKRYNHDGRAFSTYDHDHDRYTGGNCAQYYGAGWWFDSCMAANLNGRYYRGRYTGITDGIYWGTWYILTDSRTGERYSFKSVEMKTRPKMP
ncbi:microfibril-associated glycoprotein 4 [Trichomycterus rosablanca]|uniref:microfibril-associated glycoprotein 4 n=1 Tax=Trichomycterus rosablanca TaxID=2290929 RepID=UPI002F351B38